MSIFNGVFFYLGTINYGVYASTDEYVPKRVMQNLDTAGSSMLESGLSHFYTSFANFISNFRLERIIDEKAVDIALTIEQLKTPFIICLVLFSISSIHY